MSKIQEQDEYHGPALMQIVEFPKFKALNKNSDGKYGHYVVNLDRHLMVKYSTKSKGPWSFTFQPADLSVLQSDMDKNGHKTFVILVCGGDSICILDENQIQHVIDVYGDNQQSVKVEYPEGGSFRVSGSKAELKRKVPHKAFPGTIFE